MTTTIIAGDFDNLANNCDHAASEVAGTNVSAESGAASTAMPGGSAGGALPTATGGIDKRIRQLIQALQQASSAAVQTQTEFNGTDCGGAAGMDTMAGAINPSGGIY
ncbi:hypothetical protein [uncultured Gulosibacter sp.]|uniref:hypothetical protein n=1 Tax=uncultured Gulosibacter sp. TaxID=1339167 RepID=UPI00288A96FD|nr:hypothetical protein [uncultured Gulosibacter sp.]